MRTLEQNVTYLKEKSIEELETLLQEKKFYELLGLDKTETVENVASRFRQLQQKLMDNKDIRIILGRAYTEINGSQEKILSPEEQACMEKGKTLIFRNISPLAYNFLTKEEKNRFTILLGMDLSLEAISRLPTGDKTREITEGQIKEKNDLIELASQKERLCYEEGFRLIQAPTFQISLAEFNLLQAEEKKTLAVYVALSKRKGFNVETTGKINASIQFLIRLAKELNAIHQDEKLKLLSPPDQRSLARLRAKAPSLKSEDSEQLRELNAKAEKMFREKIEQEKLNAAQPMQKERILQPATSIAPRTTGTSLPTAEILPKMEEIYRIGTALEEIEKAEKIKVKIDNAYNRIQHDTRRNPFHFQGPANMIGIKGFLEKLKDDNFISYFKKIAFTPRIQPSDLVRGSVARYLDIHPKFIEAFEEILEKRPAVLDDAGEVHIKRYLEECYQHPKPYNRIEQFFCSKNSKAIAWLEKKHWDVLGERQQYKNETIFTDARILAIPLDSVKLIPRTMLEDFYQRLAKKHHSLLGGKKELFEQIKNELSPSASSSQAATSSQSAASSHSASSQPRVSSQPAVPVQSTAPAQSTVSSQPAVFSQPAVPVQSTAPSQFLFSSFCTRKRTVPESDTEGAPPVKRLHSQR